jgi:hypothetical protein
MPQKILVEVLDNSGIKQKKKCVVEGTKVIVRKKSGKGKNYKPAYKAGFDESCLLYYRGMWPFRFLKRKLQLIDGHNHCIKFDYKKKTVDFSRFDATQFFKGEVLDKSGNVKMKVEVPFVLYMILGIILVMNIVSILVFTGRLRV